MTEFPKITIITPSFNQGKYLEATIQSILNQNYPNLEYFVIDGGSSDESVEIIKKHESQIDFWVSEKDNGQSHAINKGLERATGDIINWINSDDQLTEGSLFKIAEYFQSNPKVAVVHGKTILFKENGWEMVKGAESHYLPEWYFAGIAFPQPSAFFTKEALARVGGKVDESLHYGMDYDLYGKMALHYDFLDVPEIFSKYLLHPTSKTTMSNLAFAEDWKLVFNKMLRSLPKEQSEKLLKQLDLLGMNCPKVANYDKATKEFSKEYLEKSFCLFVRFQLYYHYEDLVFDKVKKILNFLKSEYPRFYESENLGKLQTKIKLPFKNIIVPFLRKFSR